MPKNSFEIGDTVMLKSGGPMMTYSSHHESFNKAHCIWFDGNNKLQDNFEYDTLVKEEDA